jgi:hypothetical protein
MNYVLLGAFDGCPGIAAQSELADLLKAGHAEVREYYQRILFEVLQQQLLTKTTS